MKEEKVSNDVLPWAALHFHSAKVLLIGVAELFTVALRKQCDV